MAATSEIEKLERRYAENPDGRYFAPLADAYRKAGQVDRALELVRSGLGKHPDYLSAHIVLGRCLLDKKDDPNAAQAFQSVLGLDPENIIALKSLAEIAERKGELVQSREWLQQLLKIDPMNTEAEADLKRLGGAIAAATTAQVPAVTPPVEAPAAPEISFADVAPAAALEASAPAAPSAEAPAPLVAAEAPAPLVAAEAAEAADAAVSAAAAPVAEAETLAMGAGFLPPHPPEAPPTAPEAESVVRPSEGIVPSQFAPPQEEVPGQPLDVRPFDDTLAWGTGERSSRAISQRDLDVALHEHEASLAEASEALGVKPGEQHFVAEPVPTEEAWTGGPSDDAWEGRASLQMQKVDESSITVEKGPEDTFEIPEEPPAAEESGATALETPHAAAPAGAGAEPSGWDLESLEGVAEAGLAAAPGAGAEDAAEPGAPPAAGAEPEPAAPAPEPEAAPPAAEAAEAAPAEEGARTSLEDLPIIMPEDVTPPEEMSRPSGKQHPAIAAPEPAAPLVAHPEAQRTPLLTETMGDLYLRQGFRAEAADVYRRLLAQRPGDAGLKAKLAELEAPPPALGASALGTESARTWLRRVAQARVGAPAAGPGPAPAGLSPLEQAFGQGEAPAEPAGEPARPAQEAFTLDAIFGAASTTQAAPPAPPPPPTGTSFDEFFGAPPEQGSVRPDPDAGPATPPPEDDVGSFNSWLRGLKR